MGSTGFAWDDEPREVFVLASQSTSESHRIGAKIDQVDLIFVAEYLDYIGADQPHRSEWTQSKFDSVEKIVLHQKRLLNGFVSRGIGEANQTDTAQFANGRDHILILGVYICHWTASNLLTIDDTLVIGTSDPIGINHVIAPYLFTYPAK